MWLSEYRFHQRLLPQLCDGQVFFAGDAAHLMAPFGARGMNSAIQDVENLAWKLAYVLQGKASPALLETYQSERWPAQQHNQLVTDATMRFMAPRGRWQRLRRDAILRLSRRWKHARQWVNSGTMSEPFSYDTGRHEPWEGAPLPGAKAPDGPIADGFLRHALGTGFVALQFSGTRSACPDLAVVHEPHDGPLGQIYAASPGAVFLIRPDGHIAARSGAMSEDELNALVRQLLRPPVQLAAYTA